MLSIKEMSELNRAIYSESNEQLDFEYMYSYLTRKISYLSRGFLRTKSQDNEEVMHTFIQSLSWLFSICQLLDIDPQEAFYKKFPSCCPYCLKKPCLCTQTHRKPEKINSAIYIKSELNSVYHSYIKNRENSIDPTRMINEIYPSNKNIWGVFGGFYHSSRLFEELGELHESYCRLKKDENYNRDNLSEECADIFAWLYSLWGINFTQELWSKFQDYYINGCPVCNHKQCICKPYSGRISVTDSKKALLTDLMNDLSKLSNDKELGEYKTNIDAALTSLQDAIDSGKDIDSRRTIDEVESVLESVNKSSSHVSGIINNSASIITVIRGFMGF
ncbi:hypothetical protein QPK77_08120 [Providencia rettgeri]|nr:hypothetical protein [Providencia rettgeri]MDK3007906.1 hypothetical protein [Providencia rettgeri]